MKLVEHRYKCLFNILKIKEKAILYKYFHKYRNIVSFQTANNIFLNRKSKENNSFSNSVKDKLDKNNNDNGNYKLGKKYYLNKKNNKSINANNNNLSNVNKNISPIENNLVIVNNITSKKSEILNKIINKKESKINKLILNNIFNKWKNIIQNIFVLPNLRNNKNQKYKSTKLVLNDNKISVKPKIKCIKVRKIKSERSNNFSHIKSINSGKVSLNSFDSDNINVRKMKVHKIKVFTDSTEIKNSLTKDLNSKYKISDFVDNSQFIQKIANISRKISNKSNIFKCFILWKKKTKDIN